MKPLSCAYFFIALSIGTSLSFCADLPGDRGSSQRTFPSPGALLQKAYLKEAEKGDVSAQFELGFLYLSGKNQAEQDFVKAREWLMKSAENNHSKAQLMLVAIYHDGLGVEKNSGEAVRWLQKAIEKKRGRGDYNLDSNQLAIAHRSLGECFMYGDGVKEDLDKAFKHYSDSAALGDAEAQVQVGIFHASGWSVKEDQQEAVKWFKRAAMQGEFGGFYMLGDCYKEGKGVPQNFVEAHKWYNLAATAGNVGPSSKMNSKFRVLALNAFKVRDELAKQMTPEQIAEAQKRAEQFSTARK